MVNTLGKLDIIGVVGAATGTDPPNLEKPTIAWEYWNNGARWRELGVVGDKDGVTQNFGGSGTIRFYVPEGWEPNAVLNDTRRWLRARLASGSFTHLRFVSWTDAKTHLINLLPVVEPRPPVLDSIEVFFPRRVAERTSRDRPALQRLPVGGRHPRARRSRTRLRPLPADARPLADALSRVRRALSPAHRLGLFVQLQSPDPDARPLALTWEGYDGVGWRTLAAEDASRGLSAHGVVGLLWPGDASPPGAEVLGAAARVVTLAERDAAARFAPGDRVVVRDPRGGEPGVVTAVAGGTLTLRDPVSRPYVGGEVVEAPPARFGTPRTWLGCPSRRDRRPARRGPGRTPDERHRRLAARLRAPAEVTGSSDGSPHQVVFVRRPPILEDEIVEVRELDGQRAPFDLPIFRRDLASAGMVGALRVVRDPRNGQVSEVLGALDRAPEPLPLLVLLIATTQSIAAPVGCSSATASTAASRRPPPTTSARSYRTGGGATGNVAAGAISAMISAIPATGDQPAAGVRWGRRRGAGRRARRGPSLLRHRRVAITTADAADIARETCPAVARARVLGARDQFGRTLPGHTRVIVIPDVDFPRPQPDAELRRRVRVALAARAPATAAAGITVIGPDYVPVGASVAVRPAQLAEPGVVRTTVLAELERLLHPLRGGPASRGYDFGRSVFLSDLARALEALPGVDVVTDLALTRDAVEQGERVDVGPGNSSAPDRSR